jgi:hypothetical protein
MNDYLNSSFICERNIKIHEIPAIIFRPKEVKAPIPTIVFYHGWSSSKELQRLRGFILASVGYQVVIPDAAYHGERNPLQQYGQDAAMKYFWDIIFSNMEEFKTIKDDMELNYEADPKRIAVMGNSMGGFTSAGIFAQSEDLKALIVLNGCCGWESFNSNIDVPTTEKVETIRRRVKHMDPMNNLDVLKDRPILLLHGDSDIVVPVGSQRIFYKKIKTLYEDKNKIKLIEYPRLNHFVTTNMMEESINWLGKYL